MPTITRADIVTHYEQTGEGPDIVWICGGGGVPERTWNVYQVPEFPDFRNTVFHNRGIGQTTAARSSRGRWRTSRATPRA